jgi:glycosyltransferase involved in cell wall biosynthesis
LVERRTLARAAALHVTSDLEAAEIDRLGLVAAPMVLIENGVEIPAPEPDGHPEAEDAGARAARAASAQVPSGLDRLSTGDPHRGTAGSAVLDDSPGTAELGRSEADGRPAGTGDFAPKSHGEATKPAELSAPVRAALARRPLLLFLGRVSWKKGLDRLVPALTGVPGATLAIAGNDEEGHGKQLEQLAAAQGVTGRVLFLGPVHGAAKAALLHGADLLVLPSYSENFGNVVLEAMAAALPVVVTPEVGLAAVVRDSGAGLVAEGDPPRLAAALRGLLADAGLRRAMGERGAAEVARRFGWDTIAGRMEEVYRQILAAGGAREGPR